MSTLQSITDSSIHYLGRLGEAAPIKLSFAVGASLLGWLTSPGITQAAILLLIADWLTGVTKGMCLHQINSDSGVRGAVKTLVYFSLLWVVSRIGCTGAAAAQVSEWIGLLIVYTEAVSNLENLDAIATHFGADIPILKQAIAVLRMKVAQDPSTEMKGDPHVE